MTGRIRVAQVITRFIAGAGGITLRGALALDAQRFAVTIMAADGGPLFAEAERAGFEVVRLNHMRPEISPREDVRGIKELTSLLGFGAFDLVHTHSAKAGAIGRIAARRAGVPVIVHSFHGFPFHEFQNKFRRSMYIWIERWLGRMTHQFFTDGTFVASEAVRLGIAPPERIRAIASPIRTDIAPISRARRAAARRLLRLPAGMQVVGSVGRLDHQKAPLDLVDALAAVRRLDVCAVWVGDGPLRGKVEKAIAAKGLRDRFFLLGEREDIPDLLPGFDVFAMSSLYEGLPCAVIEAMACGLPVVATAVNSVPEIVIPGQTGLLARPGDSASLGAALAFLLDHPTEAMRMATVARDRLGDRFTPAALGRDLTEVYEQALGELSTSPSYRSGADSR